MKYLKYGLLSALIVCSFYFTDKIMIYMENKNPIMAEINEKENQYKTTFVNAVIEDNTIIPGINGKEINKRKTLTKMDEFGSFNETFIIYDEIKPEISIKDNLDKIIVKGNSLKRSVSLVVEPDSQIESYLASLKIKYSLIATVDSDLTKEREYINGESNKEKMSDLHVLLNKNKINSQICLIDYSNTEYCQTKKYYIAAPTIDTNINITKLLSSITSGDIILIKRKTSLENLDLILSEIKRQDLDIIYLGSLISESN